MPKRPLPIVTVTLDKIVGGGQAIATMEDGRKLFVWGGLPGETVEVQLTRKKSKLAEGIVTNVITASPERIEPQDPDSFLSTSPWQLMAFESEQTYKAALIKEAFQLHHITLPNEVEIYSDSQQFGYRNKMEFSWWWDKDAETLDLAFFRRGTHGKFTVTGSSLASPAIEKAALQIRDVLRARHALGLTLKTLLIRSNSAGEVAAQLYVKNEKFAPFTKEELAAINVASFELIFSNPKSPASVITERLQQSGKQQLSDSILGIDFGYATEGFFQINLPVYEQALKDMKEWVSENAPTIDLYSGVGTIGLTIGQDPLTLVEINEHAVREMRENIERLGRKNATAVLAPSEKALDHISGDATIILDPPRAGLDKTVTDRLLETEPKRIIYLSCNPVTQARDVELLQEKYSIVSHRGYNFFPRTPHIEHLVILDLKIIEQQ